MFPLCIILLFNEIISFCLMTIMVYLLIYHMFCFSFFSLSIFFPLSVMSGKSQCHHPSPYITALTATGSCQKHHPSTFHHPTNQHACLGCHRQQWEHPHAWVKKERKERKKNECYFQTFKVMLSKKIASFCCTEAPRLSKFSSLVLQSSGVWGLTGLRLL